MQLVRKTHATLACRITNFHYGRYIKKRKARKIKVYDNRCLLEKYAAIPSKGTKSQEESSVLP